MGKVSHETEIAAEAVKSFHAKARKHDIKADDVSEALPCCNVSVDGAKARELCPKTAYIRELKTGLYELKRRLKNSDVGFYPGREMVFLINKLLEKGR